MPLFLIKTAYQKSFWRQQNSPRNKFRYPFAPEYMPTYERFGHLISLNTPYGEQFSKYDKLSKYIIKANSIHVNISQDIRKK